MSSANLVTLAYVKETVVGVTPATPAFKYVRFTGESLNLAITSTASTEIRPDRAQSDTTQVSSDAAGDINIELSFLSFRDFIAGAFANHWVVDGTDATIERIVNGTILDTFSLEKAFTDIGQFHLFKGLCVEGWKFSMKVGSILTGSFTMKALSNTPSNATTTGATHAAAPATPIMNAVTSVQAIMIDGVPFTGCASQVDMEFKNNIRAIDCIGLLTHRAFVLGTWEATGSINFYFADGSNYLKFSNGTEFAFAFELLDSLGNTYTFELPRCKFESGEVVAGGQNTDVTFNAKFRALFDTVSGHVAQIEANAI